MKHTDFYLLTETVKKLEIQELKDAVNAHNGLYQWKVNENCPIVAVNLNCSEPHPLDVCITKVYNEDGHIQIDGIDKHTHEPVDFVLSDIFAGHIANIIDLIPETVNVFDVSLIDLRDNDILNTPSKAIMNT